MILCMDTCYKSLTLALIDDNRIIAAVDQDCFKKQSEMLMKELDTLLKENDVTLQDLEGVCVTKGPGSYTGVRIAMTVAKLIASQLNLKLYVISTLRLYAGNKENTAVIMDARAKRSYFGIFNKDEVIKEDTVVYNEELNDYSDYNMIGDLHLMNGEDKFYKISECFLDTMEYWEEVEDIDTLTPVYLKDYA